VLNWAHIRKPERSVDAVAQFGDVVAQLCRALSGDEMDIIGYGL
jgi:hypothetical protein